MSTSLVLAIDAGTTGIRTILYDRRGREVASVYREFTQITPAPGLLEHDPDEIWAVDLNPSQNHLLELKAAGRL